MLEQAHEPAPLLPVAAEVAFYCSQQLKLPAPGDAEGVLQQLHLQAVLEALLETALPAVD